MLTPRGSVPTLGVSGPQAAASLVSADVWANVKVECEPSWQAFQGHCYRLQAEKRSWQESKKVCLRGGGDLLSIHSMAELEFITKQIKQGEEPPPQACPARTSRHTSLAGDRMQAAQSLSAGLLALPATCSSSL